MLRRFIRTGTDMVAASIQRLPVTSRIAGPPKGYYRSFAEYARSVPYAVANEWPVLAPESAVLAIPAGVSSEERTLFRPVDHRSPGFSLYSISRGRFHRDARTILTCDDRILAPFSAHMGSGPEDNWLFHKWSLGKLRHLPGKSLLLVCNPNYYHFLIEEFPRICLARRAGFALEMFDHLLMFSPVHDSQKTLCRRVGIDPQKIAPLERTPHVECEELYFATMPWDYGPTFLKMSRDFLFGLAHHSSLEASDRIYVSRERCTHGKITNEPDLMRWLSGLGFKKVLPEALSFDDQVALFSRASIIIGAHGAGLTDLVFCRPGCTIIEIRNPTFSEVETYHSRGGNIFWRFSQFLNFRYHPFFTRPDQTHSKPPDGQVVEAVRLPNVTVDIDRFMEFLNSILPDKLQGN